MPNPNSNDEKLRDLNQLTSLVEKRSLNDYEFKRATGSLAQNLKFVSDAMRNDPDVWRMNRAFHAVHVPSFLTVMTMLDDVDDMKSIGEDERHQIYSSINRAAQLALSARDRIEQSALTETQVELSVLANYAPASKKEFKKASLFERTRDGFLSASNTTLHRAKDSVDAVPNMLEALKMECRPLLNARTRCNCSLPTCSEHWPEPCLTM